MTALAFIKEKKVLLASNLLLMVFYIGYMHLNKVPYVPILTMIIIWIGALTTFLVAEFVQKSRYYNKVLQDIKNIDKKHLAVEVIEEANFLEGHLLYDILKQTSKSMNDEISKYKRAEREYREYIETWVHEIKTPIASSMLIIENNKAPVTLSIKEEIDQIEQFVEQALYYAKSSSVEKDFLIKQVDLEVLVNKVIKKNASSFIHKHIAVDVDIQDHLIYGDSKWLDFMVNQILLNSIKYVKASPCIKLYTTKEQGCIVLYIEDNGVGISEQDLPRVFEKGFTGSNGRVFGQSTGMGLYIVKQLAEKMEIGIKLESKANSYTKVKLIFPNNKYISMC